MWIFQQGKKIKSKLFSLKKLLPSFLQIFSKVAEKCEGHCQLIRIKTPVMKRGSYEFSYVRQRIRNYLNGLKKTHKYSELLGQDFDAKFNLVKI